MSSPHQAPDPYAILEGWLAGAYTSPGGQEVRGRAWDDDTRYRYALLLAGTDAPQSIAVLLQHIHRHDAAGPTWRLPAKNNSASAVTATTPIPRPSSGHSTSSDRCAPTKPPTPPRPKARSSSHAPAAHSTASPSPASCATSPPPTLTSKTSPNPPTRRRCPLPLPLRQRTALSPLRDPDAPELDEDDDGAE
ncbi:hypothetical protein GCM10010271_70170 [Streptomyces kurssanovii]|nr:hypothetical protein GCM10010271_70170 [Streptomyces kurssanovii]